MLGFQIKVVSPHKVMTSTVKTQKNVTNISITSDPNPKTAQQKADIQVFQKGPDVTALVANLPGLEIGGKDTVEASANLPIIRPRSNQSNISSTQIEIGSSPKSNASKSCSNSVEHNEPTKRPYVPVSHIHYNHKYNKNSNSRYSLQPSRSSNFLSQGEEDIDSNSEKKPYCLRQSMSHHSIHNSKEHRNFDYNSETSAALEIIKKNQRQYIEANYRLLKEKKSRTAHSDDNSDIIKSYKRDHRKSLMDCYSKDSKDSSKLIGNPKAMEILKYNGDYPMKDGKAMMSSDKRLSHNFVSHNDEYSDFHPERDYIDHRIDGKVIQNAHKSSRRLSKLHMRNIKSPDCDSEPSQISNEDKYKKSRTKLIDYTSEPNSIIGGYNKKNLQYLDRPRPTPPKKPLRLSLHRAQSMQSVEPDGNQSEKFYLHDPQERLKIVSDKQNDELKYSLANSKAVSEDIYYDKENKGKIKSYLYQNHVHIDNRLKHQSKEYSKSEEIIEHSDKERRTISNENHVTKKRPNCHNHETEQNGGYASSRSESLSSVSKNQRVKLTNHVHLSENSSAPKPSEEFHYNGLKKELHIKAHKNGTNGHINNKNELISENTKSNSHHGFKWSSNIFKNIRIDSSPKVNGHMSDGSKK